MFVKNIVRQSLGYAAAAVAYIAGVATFMNNAERILGQDDSNVLMPIIFLLLLVVSASTMGLLIFGKPMMLYIDGKKREGITMAIYTISCLAMFTVLLLSVLILM